MPHGRWYPTLTELPDGRVLILGGWDETGGRDNGGAAQPALMDNDQDVEVFDPSTPAGGQATTVVSKLPPDGPGQPTPYPDHRGLGLYPHVFVLPSTTTLGAGGHTVLVAGPTRYDSAVIDTTDWVWTDVISQHPDTGQSRLSQDRAWGTAWLAPSDTDGSTSVVLLGGADTAGPAPGPGAAPAAVGTSETLDLDLAIADPASGWKLGSRPTSTSDAATSTPPCSRTARSSPTAAATAARTTPSTPIRSIRPSCWSPARRGGWWGARTTPAPITRPHCFCPTGRWSRRATTATSPPPGHGLGLPLAHPAPEPHRPDLARRTSSPGRGRPSPPSPGTSMGTTRPSGRGGRRRTSAIIPRAALVRPGRGDPRQQHDATGHRSAAERPRGRPRATSPLERDGRPAGLLHALRAERRWRDVGGHVGPHRPALAGSAAPTSDDAGDHDAPTHRR